MDALTYIDSLFEAQGSEQRLSPDNSGYIGLVYDGQVRGMAVDNVRETDHSEVGRIPHAHRFRWARGNPSRVMWTTTDDLVPETREIVERWLQARGAPKYLAHLDGSMFYNTWVDDIQ